MPFIWMVECKTCLGRFGVKPREVIPGKATEGLPKHEDAGEFECPHCHEIHEYTTDDFIPGEGRIVHS